MIDKYGAENVSRIITFGTFAAKQSLRDVARALGHPASTGAKLAGMVPGGKITIAEALQINPDLKNAYGNPTLRPIIDIAMRIEGGKRNASQHACFAANTLITTDTGVVPIKDIQAGDMVLTHRGRFRPVVETMVTDTDVVYTVDCQWGRVEVTGNHPLLARTFDEPEPRWKPVSELTTADYLCFPLYARDAFVTHGLDSSGVAAAGWEGWARIQCLSARQEHRLMYNLTVLDDSSYVANGIAAHNCGLAVSPSAVSDYMPTSMETDEETGEKGLTTQVIMTEVEELSLIKMDLLGLKNMSVIQEVLSEVCRRYGKEEILRQLHSTKDTVHYLDIPLDDRETYRMLMKGNTGGVFQFESEGMTKVVSQMMADVDSLPDERVEECFERLIAAVALYRPGPMDYIPNYMAGMRDPSKIHYDCPEEEEILKSTYGVIVYQEQVMQIVRTLAGYSAGRSDVVRKAMGKKKHDLLAKEKEVFLHGNAQEVAEAKAAGKEPPREVPGCVGKGISEKVANEIWAKMKNFASYAFNRSHAACYAYIAYITAYMSCHWPKEFYAAMLNAFILISDKVKQYLAQAEDRGIKLLLPDINQSREHFSATDDGILFGLQGISGLKSTAVHIVAERDRGGEFADYQDLYERLQKQGVKLGKKDAEGLAYSGSLDGFCPNRAAMLAYHSIVEKDYKANAAVREMGQYTLFSPEEDKLPIPDTPPLSKNDALEKERAALGMYVSSHPMDEVSIQVKQSPAISPLEELARMDIPPKFCKTVGLIKDIRVFYTKKKEQMASFTVETKLASLPCVIFPRDLPTCMTALKENTVVGLCGKVGEDNRDGKRQLYVSEIGEPDSLLLPSNGIVALIHNKTEQEAVLSYIRAHPGRTQVTLVSDGVRFPLKQRVHDDQPARAFFEQFKLPAEYRPPRY